jgi:bifunctional non-homologous end joining protein LigD
MKIHPITLTNTKKILFTKDKITKGDLIAYYKKIAPIMLPYIKDRAVTLHRFPDGITKEGFYQKDISDYFPSWIKRKAIPKEGGKNTYVVCNDADTLVYLANQACITPHIWLSTINNLKKPTRMIFDLDPGKTQDFELVRQTALLIRKALKKHNLTSYVMTTGSRGVHIVIPLDGKETFDTVRAYARAIAQHVVAQNPKQLTIEPRLNKRRGRLFIDITRNAYAQTTAAPYAVRAKHGAPVATPLTWKELENKKITAQTFTIKNIFGRLKKQNDPWKSMLRKKQSLRF